MSCLLLDHELDMSLSSYNKIERDEVDFTISKVQKIAQVMGVDISQLLNLDATQIYNMWVNLFATEPAGTNSETINLHADDYKNPSKIEAVPLLF